MKKPFAAAALFVLLFAVGTFAITHTSNAEVLPEKRQAYFAGPMSPKMKWEVDSILFLEPRPSIAILDTSYHALTPAAPFLQNWTDILQIVTDDSWLGVLAMLGYRGDDLTTATGADPQTILANDSTNVIDVNSDETNPNTLTTGGVAEFHITNPVVALQGSGTADAPLLQVRLNTSSCPSPANSISVSYNVRDIDGSADNAIQPVALQYRTTDDGAYTNLPSAFVADATTGPSLATLVTPVSVTLPSIAQGQPILHLRFITANATGNDEWVGIDDINVTCNADTTPPVVPVITGSNPSSPSSDNTPDILGTAEADSLVKLYTTSDCTGTILGQGTATGGNFSIPVTVPTNATTTMYANATDSSSNVSSCSGPFSYTHFTEPTISIDNVTGLESDPPDGSVFGFTVSLSSPSLQTITVQYSTADDTAVAPGDYTTVTPTTITFLPGDTEESAEVNLVTDNDVESDETFFVNLSSPTNATIADGQGVGTIQNDDAASTATKALWVFGGSIVPNPVSDGAGRATLISRSSAAEVNRLFVSVYRSTANTNGRLMYQDADMAALNAAADAAGQQVWAAYGAPDWPTFGCTAGDFPVQRMAEVAAFNASRPANEQFDGVMLDVEPNPTTEAQFRALFDHYKCMRTSLPPSIKLGAAINAFWDDDLVEYPLGSGITKPASQHIIDLVELDSIVVMGYRDTAEDDTCPASDGIICLDKSEIDYATSINRPGLVLAGLETINPTSAGLLDKETFFEEGYLALDVESTLVESYFAPSSAFGGFAIHNYSAAYLSATENWPVGNLMVVNSTGDGADANLGDSLCETATGNGVCTLRAATQEANTEDGADTIVFNLGGFRGGSSTIVLGSEIVITSDLAISGPGANSLVISGNNASRVFYIAPGNTVTLDALTIADGSVTGLFPTGAGAGILNDEAALTVSNSVVRNNTSTNGYGGGIYNDSGVLTVSFSTIRNNTANSEGGGGIASRSTSTDPPTLNVINSTISANTAFSGGGIYSQSISGIPVTLNITSSTISGNSSGVGGGILSSFNSTGSSTLNVSNSTVSSNNATSNGGGIQNGGAATLNSTIVSDNTAPAAGPDINNSGVGTVGGSYNLVETTTGYTFSSGTNNIFGVDAQLGSLADNGGPTFTHRPAGGFPGHDKGCAFGVVTDQRGFTRTNDWSAISNAVCTVPSENGTDIGAVELVAPTAAPASIGGRITTAGGRGIANVRVTIRNMGGETVGTALSSTFGYFSVEGLSTGNSYVVMVNAKRYVFSNPSRVVTLSDDIDGVDFVAEP